jgi:hypothetical protein
MIDNNLGSLYEDSVFFGRMQCFRDNESMVHMPASYFKKILLKVTVPFVKTI